MDKKQVVIDCNNKISEFLQLGSLPSSSGVFTCLTPLGKAGLIGVERAVFVPETGRSSSTTLMSKLHRLTGISLTENFICFALQSPL